MALLAACGRGSAAPTRTPEPVLHLINETPCVIHFRFDNADPKGRVQPNASVDYIDARLTEYRTAKIESTLAIFRTYDMAQIRADGYSLTVRPAFDDHPCVEKPDGTFTPDAFASPIP